MTLSEKQHIFAQNLAKLLLHIESVGLSVSIGEIERTKEQAELYAKEGKGITDSLHCKRLAADLFLFANNIYLEKKEDYEPIGKYWESLHPMNRWGGSFKRADYVHFEMQDI